MFRRKTVLKAKLSSNFPSVKTDTQDPAFLAVRKSSRSKSVDSGTECINSREDVAKIPVVVAKTSRAKSFALKKTSKFRCVHCILFKQQRREKSGVGAGKSGISQQQKQADVVGDQRLGSFREGMTASSSIYSWENYFKLMPSKVNRTSSVTMTEDTESTTSSSKFSLT